MRQKKHDSRLSRSRLLLVRRRRRWFRRKVEHREPLRPSPPQFPFPSCPFPRRRFFLPCFFLHSASSIPQPAFPPLDFLTLVVYIRTLSLIQTSSRAGLPRPGGLALKRSATHRQRRASRIVSARSIRPQNPPRVFPHETTIFTRGSSSTNSRQLRSIRRILYDLLRRFTMFSSPNRTARVPKNRRFLDAPVGPSPGVQNSCRGHTNIADASKHFPSS